MIRPAELAKPEQLKWSVGPGTDVWDLFCACINGDLDKVKQLVNNDPSLVRSDYEYRNALGFAVRKNQLAVAEFLLVRGADPIVYGNLREVARHRGFVEMTELLDEWNRGLGADTNGEAVAAAIRGRDLRKVMALLDASPDLVHTGDLRTSQPIHWAVMTRQIDIIDELLRRGADIDAQRLDGARPIHLTNGDYFYRDWRDVPPEITSTPGDVYAHLVERGAKVDLGMAAATADRTRVTQILNANPQSVNQVSDYGSYYIGCGALLKNAVLGGDIEIVKMMVDRGADLNLPEEGIAPEGHALYTAVSRGLYEIAELLLKHGAIPNPAVESSADAVSIAIMNNDTRILKLLASYGAIWELDMRPRTSLTYEEIVATGIKRSINILASYGDLETAKTVFEANPDLANDREALKSSAGNGHEEFVRLMLTYQPDLAMEVTVSKPRAMAEFLFDRGMNPNLPDWLL